ncbi:hypothetical protein SAMN05660350_00999 [Geodermatophilus obscurus]|uniref:Uncharacterized protein n=1 Tax=Geodermatophilus obscurus TaxID=1861 RepID=A0A1M7SQU8_9ACTN|nr:hypothetical protein [Geodermatophilus obscurus]SHN60738.1 hypothetical protein SAMN05660350_00999 [Geodermatophilus obscurus]
MNEVLSGDLVRLKRETGGPRLSLFLPLSPGSPRSMKTRVRAKNLLAGAGHALLSDGLSSVEVTDLVGRVRQALEQARPLSDNHLGLAVFADTDHVRAYHVPLRPRELAVVGDRFTIAPLLPTINVQGQFFLLTLTQDDIRLFTGTALALARVDVEGLELAAWTTMPRPRAPQVHAFLADRGGRGTRAVFHGVGRDSDERKTRALQHFRGIDRALREVLGEQAPLVLAGVRHLQALYRAVNTHPRLLDEGIDGNPEQRSRAELHRRAWALVESEMRRDASTAIERYHDLRGTGRTVDGLQESLRAAIEGRVETLLVNVAACTWASPSSGRPVLRLGSPPTVEERLESAVVTTLSRDGAVFVVPDLEMPGSSPAVAIVRS